jgi:hypothetical protein
MSVFSSIRELGFFLTVGNLNPFPYYNFHFKFLMQDKSISCHYYGETKKLKHIQLRLNLNLA